MRQARLCASRTCAEVRLLALQLALLHERHVIKERQRQQPHRYWRSRQEQQVPATHRQAINHALQPGAAVLFVFKPPAPNQSHRVQLSWRRHAADETITVAAETNDKTGSGVEMEGPHLKP